MRQRPSIEFEPVAAPADDELELPALAPITKESVLLLLLLLFALRLDDAASTPATVVKAITFASSGGGSIKSAQSA